MSEEAYRMVAIYHSTDTRIVFEIRCENEGIKGDLKLAWHLIDAAVDIEDS